MLKGKLTHLRPVEESDVDCYLSWVNDPDLARLVLCWPAPVCRAQIIKTFNDPLISHDSALLFAIEILAERKVIGFCFLKNVHSIHRLAELEQFFIGERKYRRNGYGLDVMGILLNYCFAELNLNRLWLLTYLYNQEAILFYERCGFLKEGVLRQVQFTQGKYHDGLIMGILEADWRGKINHSKELLPKGQSQFPLL